MPRKVKPSGSTPISRRRATASGMSPSPQALSIGGWKRSRTAASSPASLARIAVASPEGPPPMTTRSAIAAPPVPRISQARPRHCPRHPQRGDRLGRLELAGEPEAQSLLPPELARGGAREGPRLQHDDLVHWEPYRSEHGFAAGLRELFELLGAGVPRLFHEEHEALAFGVFR